MSLEQAILELASAIRVQAAAIVTGTFALTEGDAPAAPAPAATTPTPADKPKRGRPAKIVEAPAATAIPHMAGDAEGTTYWHHPKHDSVYRIVPGDGTPGPMEGSQQIDGASFLAHQSRLALKHASARAPAPVAATSTPTATVAPAAAPTASAPTGPEYGAVRAALLQLAANDPENGRAKVLAVLAAVNVNTVPELVTASPDVLAAVLGEIAQAAAPEAPATNALFG